MSGKYRLPDTTNDSKTRKASPSQGLGIKSAVLLPPSGPTFSAAQVFLRLRKRHGRLSRLEKRSRSTREVTGRAALRSISFFLMR